MLRAVITIFFSEVATGLEITVPPKMIHCPISIILAMKSESLSVFQTSDLCILVFMYRYDKKKRHDH